MTLCPPINLHATHRPSALRPAPSPSERKSIARNLFGNAPGDSNIDELLAKEQRKMLIRIKECYNFDILAEEQREQEAAEITGQRFPYQSVVTPPLSDSATTSPKSCPEATPPSMGAGVAISAQQISIAIKRMSSNSSSDLASSSTIHGLKRKYRVRKNVPKIIKMSYEISNNINNSNNNVDNGTCELGNAEQ
ncbi:gliolectin [Drosophila kikkawai]|uniref:Gliolectin n=1 Tax=Drosophila kikkawai TaxID=30033 RepID=A0A6P4IDL2_DROKI|nr:gliolectin [Drosophila kikkawai]